MTIGPFHVGQVPANPLVLTVRDDEGNERDLTGYDSIEIMIFDPSNVLLDASGDFSIDPVNPTYPARVVCHWPSASLFAVPGIYDYQLVLIGPDTTLDMTGVQRFEVDALGAMPTGSAVLDYVGNDAATDPQMLDLVSSRLPIVTVFAKAYTRGNGFTDGVPNEELAAVITTAAAREISVESLGATREQIGEHYSVFYATDPCNWTLRELSVLNSYRRRAA